MAETVGTKTEQKTSAGKDVYKTPEGESVSEKSVTIKFGDNAYVNAPSIYKGKKYTEDEVKEMLLEGIIKPTSRHDTLEEAIESAETRSDNLLKDGGMALNEQQLKAIQEDIKDKRSKKERIDDQMDAFKSVGQFVGETAVESIPGVSQAIGVKRTSDALEEDDYVGAGIEGTALAASSVPGVGPAVAKGLRKFNKTRKAYKLFVKSKDGELYPLFVDANKPVKQGEFLEANFPDVAFKGKRKEGSKESFYVPTKGAKRSKGEKAKGTGDSIIIPDETTRQKLIDEGFITEKTRRTKEAPFGRVTAVAARPGWHASQAPVATHLGPQDLKVNKKEAEKLVEAGVTPDAIKRRGNQFYVKRRAEDQVFAEVDMADDIDYQSMLAKEGKSDINDRVPKGGSYKYSDGQADSDQWVVGGDMKVNRILSRKETRAIQKEMGVTDLPYRDEVESILEKKFAKGGVVMDDYLIGKMMDDETSQKFAKGGMSKQMELFEPVERGFDEGGLMDEGGTVDPVSGNDVPPGSTQEEVRDDIPAQLSEGEFVIPADVVRYIGLENLMRMRQEAKQGLAQMEAMGQMGNSEQATVEDDLPFDMYDLDIEEDQSDLNFNLGGIVPVQGTGVINKPNTGPTTGFKPYVAPTVPGFNVPQLQNVQFTQAPQTTNLPTFGQVMGSNLGKYDELRRYVNDAGQVRQIPFKNGKPIYPIPEGFRFEEMGMTTPTDTSTTPVTVTGQQQDDGGGDGSGAISNIGSGVSSVSNVDTIGGIPTSDSFVDAILDSRAATEAKHENAFGGHAVFGYNNEAMRNATFEQAKQQALSLSTTGQMAATFGFTDASPTDISIAGQQAKEAALAAMAMGNVSQLGTPAEATMYGSVISAAHEAAKKGLDVSKAIQTEIANHPEAMKSGLTAAAARYGNVASTELGNPGVMAQVSEVARSMARALQGSADQVGKSGAVKDSRGKAVKTRDINTGKVKGNVMTASALARQKALEKEAKAARAAAAAAAQAAAAQEIAANAEMGVTAADFGVGSKGSTTSGIAAENVGDHSGSPGGGYGSDSGQGGGGDMGVICLTEDMKVKRNGSIDFVTKVQVGDIIDNTVVTEVLHKHMREGYYKVNGELKITNDHPVLANGSWKRTEDLVLGDYINNVKVTSLEYVEQVTPTVYIGTAKDRYDVYTEGEVYTVHGQYKNALKKAA